MNFLKGWGDAENARKENAGLENSAPKCGVEYAGLENVAPKCRGGICGTGKCETRVSMEHRKFLKASHTYISQFARSINDVYK